MARIQRAVGRVDAVMTLEKPSGRTPGIIIRWSRGRAFQRRLGYLATFLFDEKVVSKPVDVREALDASVITEPLEAWKRGQ